jgi:NAD(P)-dependent dehydrogenase (short-subunit alcohol dehydrogenase family)
VKLSNQTALVTGAGSGVGAATSELLASEGAAVVIADVALDNAKEVATRIVDKGGRAVAVRCDVSSSAESQAAVAEAVAAFGGLDIVIGNAGVRLLGRADVVATSEEDWDFIFSVNTRGNFLLAKHAVPELRRRGGGSIAFTASVTGLNAVAGNLAYGATKAALINMTKTMAIELAPDNIRVNCVCPGGVRTAMTDEALELMGPNGEAIIEDVMRRTVPLGGEMMGTDDIAEAFLYLASSAAKKVTATSLVVDGGWSAMLPRP